MDKEPLLTIGLVASAIGSFVVLMQAFGVPVTNEQSDAVQNFVTIAGPLVLALIGRQFVFSKDTTERKVDQAYAAKPGVDSKPKVEI